MEKPSGRWTRRGWRSWMLRCWPSVAPARLSLAAAGLAAAGLAVAVASCALACAGWHGAGGPCSSPGGRWSRRGCSWLDAVELAVGSRRQVVLRRGGAGPRRRRRRWRREPQPGGRWLRRGWPRLSLAARSPAPGCMGLAVRDCRLVVARHARHPSRPPPPPPHDSARTRPPHPPQLPAPPAAHALHRVYPQGAAASALTGGTQPHVAHPPADPPAETIARPPRQR